MVTMTITNARSFLDRSCFVCKNRDWIKEAEGISPLTDRSYTKFRCNHCGVIVDIGENESDNE